MDGRAAWDSTSEHNGSYAVLSVAYNSLGDPGPASPPVNFTVNNPVPTNLTMVSGYPPANVVGTKSLLATASLNPPGASVHFFLFGGGLFAQDIGTAARTYFGWLFNWDSTTVHNGSYLIAAVGYNAAGDQSAPSAVVPFTVNNPLPTTTVRNPFPGKIVKTTTATLQADATTGITASVDFYLFGPNQFGALIGSGIFSTDLGWSANWDSTSVSNGSYAIVSVAYNSLGDAGPPSPPVSFTVTNP